MIRLTTYYEIICDRCGERLELDGVTAWDDESVEPTMAYCEWQKTPDGKVICDECRLNDKDDEE